MKRKAKAKIKTPPFKVGQRIRHKFAKVLGTVTKHTKNGFRWRLDKWVITSPWSRYRTGETMPAGYYMWEAV